MFSLIIILFPGQWQSGVNSDRVQNLAEATQHLRNANAHTVGEPTTTTGHPLLIQHLLDSTSNKRTKNNADNVSTAVSVPSGNSGEESTSSPSEETPNPQLKEVSKKKRHTALPSTSSTKKKQKKSKQKKKRKHHSSSTEDSDSPDSNPKKHAKLEKKKKKFVIPKLPKKPVSSSSSESPLDTSSESEPDIQDKYDKEYEVLLENNHITESTTLYTARKIMSRHLLHKLYPNLAKEGELDSMKNFYLKLTDLSKMDKEARARGVKSVKTTLLSLDANKDSVYKTRKFGAHKDDLKKYIHPRIFHRLPAISVAKLFIKDSKCHLDFKPVSDYDYSDILGASHLSPKAWADVHQPQNYEISIKNYIPRTNQSGKQSGVVITEDLQFEKEYTPVEPANILELKKAWSLFMDLMHRTHPALLNYHTIDMFLNNKNWFADETYRRHDVKQYTFTCDFLDFVLGQCAQAYRNHTAPPDLNGLHSLLLEFSAPHMPGMYCVLFFLFNKFTFCFHSYKSKL